MQSDAPLPEETADVVVVGGGLAGHAAALAAADADARVLLVEKCANFGGSSLMAGGGLAFAGTQLQEREGVADSPRALRDDLDAAGRGKSDPQLLDAYVNTQLEVYDWLCSKGADFALSGQPVRRLHTMPSGALVKLLHERLLESERVTFRHRAPMTSLVCERGRVVGVTVSINSRVVKIRADRAVVLSTGGFSRNGELVSELAPQCGAALPMGGEGNDGDGLLLARELGAAFSDMKYVEASFGASAHEGVPSRLLYAQSDGAVIVNSRGEHFIDESSDIKTLGRAVATQPGGLAYQLFDQSVMEKSCPTPKPRDFAAALQDGLLTQANTIAELAEVAGLPLEAVQHAMSGFSQAPYYAFACKAGLTSTYGGIRASNRLEVLDERGRPIRGLFAAGEVVGGLHGAGYLIGSALGKAAVFGYVAGKSAASVGTDSGGASPGAHESHG